MDEASNRTAWRPFMLELGSPLGYPFALAVTAAAMIGAAASFQRIDWF